MENMIRLLLKRGADPNSAIVPMPTGIIRCFSHSLMENMIRLLLKCGADSNSAIVPMPTGRERHAAAKQLQSSLTCRDVVKKRF